MSKSKSAAKEYQIAALWMEGPLSFLEQLCLKSFVDAGHHVKLYHYGPLQNVPDRIELANADDVLPRTNFLTHQRTGSPALHSDLFRYRMLELNDNTIWADTDAYCMKRFESPNGHFYGWESDKHINGGVLGLPKDSDTLAALLDYTRDEFAIPVWYGEDYVRELEEKRDAGAPVHASEQPWGVWGPHAVTHFLHATGEAKYALPQEGLYPFTFKDRRMMLKRNFDTSAYVTEKTYSVHLYGRRMRARLVEREGGAPDPQSLLGRLLIKHGVNPADAPLPPPKTAQEKPAKVKKPPAPAKRKISGNLNLTDLADAAGSEQGSAKHRFTELYHMLFQPLRLRALTLLQIGLEPGQAERAQIEQHGGSGIPSLDLWLAYFSKARILGIDPGDFSSVKDPRFTPYRCDPDDPDALANTADDLPALDIVIDDGTHASHHQQNSFLALFPKLKSGGLYIIEDLRWQPPGIEKEGITKTADLFGGFQTNRRFAHANSETEAAFGSLAPEISGCFLFQAKYDKRKRDQIAVIHKA
jgi:hypothetical protein